MVLSSGTAARAELCPRVASNPFPSRGCRQTLKTQRAGPDPCLRHLLLFQPPTLPGPSASARPAAPGPLRPLTLPKARVDGVVRRQPVGRGFAAQVDQLVEAKFPAINGGGFGLQRDQQLLRVLRGHETGLREGQGGSGQRRCRCTSLHAVALRLCSGKAFPSPAFARRFCLYRYRTLHSNPTRYGCAPGTSRSVGVG